MLTFSTWIKFYKCFLSNCLNQKAWKILKGKLNCRRIIDKSCVNFVIHQKSGINIDYRKGVTIFGCRAWTIMYIIVDWFEATFREQYSFRITMSRLMHDKKNKRLVDKTFIVRKHFAKNRLVNLVCQSLNISNLCK